MNLLTQPFFGLLLFISLSGQSPSLFAFNSGSTGTEPFHPTEDTVLEMPIDGIFNFTTVIIPAGVEVTFQKNQSNTPVTILASGDILVDGVINLDGLDSPSVGSAGDSIVADDGLPGIGGPGGFDGGAGGKLNQRGGFGLGPGRGESGNNSSSGFGSGGSGAGYQALGGRVNVTGLPGGPIYGSATLLPLIGGSGGGGGHGGENLRGAGGGGGGGGLLMASSGTLTVNGSIKAKGGNSGVLADAGSGGAGGGGSGGAIRLIANTIAGNGTITATGGATTSSALSTFVKGGNGAEGRIRMEAKVLTNLPLSTPRASFAQPQPIFLAGLPNLRISSVAGIVAPLNPTGTNDIVLPEDTPNPVTVEFVSAAIPLATEIILTVIPAAGAPITSTSTPLSGIDSNATATASIDLPDGASVLSAAVSFTVTASLGADLSRFAQGETVKQVIVTANLSNGSITTLITESGRHYSWPSATLAVF